VFGDDIAAVISTRIALRYFPFETDSAFSFFPLLIRKALALSDKVSARSWSFSKKSSRLSCFEAFLRASTLRLSLLLTAVRGARRAQAISGQDARSAAWRCSARGDLG